MTNRDEHRCLWIRLEVAAERNFCTAFQSSGNELGWIVGSVQKSGENDTKEQNGKSRNIVPCRRTKSRCCFHVVDSLLSVPECGDLSPLSFSFGCIVNANTAPKLVACSVA